MNPESNAPTEQGRDRLRAIGAALLLALAALAIYISRPPAPEREFPPLPDFSSYQQADDMKAAFIDYLTPIIEYQNARILKDRERLERITNSLMNGRLVLWFDREWLKQLAEKYGVDWKADEINSVASALIGRFDIVPASLVIVQAAKESSWGQSRFAVEGNNLFGHWCYDEDCGIVPEQRPDGAAHELRKFKTVSNAVRAYLRNLNTHDSYAELRRIRQRLRGNHLPVTGIALADGLLFYSERREAYVEEVKLMIQQYHTFKNARAD